MRRAARVAMVLLLVAATGCRSASTPEPEVIAWRETPVAATIVTLASEGEDVLVGVEADGPGVLRVHDGRPQALQLAPATAYGQRARWLQISSGAAGTDSTRSIDKVFSEIPLPRTSADQGAPVPAPAVSQENAWIALPDGAGTRLWRVDDAGPTAIRPPEGRPLALQLAGDTVWLATVDSRGRTHLWRAG